MLTIDGSHGEGGGQILRTALALSMVTQTPFRIHSIRAQRQQPGLLRQHLTSVRAAVEVSRAEVRGAEIGSLELVFIPGRPQAGRYHFAVGTDGSTALVLQTLLFGLALGEKPSDLVIEGGTHNPSAPPFDFLARTFLPLLARMGVAVRVHLERAGFYPALGGRIDVHIEPTKRLLPIELNRSLQVKARRAIATVANLPRNIAERELAAISAQLGLRKAELGIVQLKNSAGPGNVLTVDVESEAHVEVFTGFGEKGIPAEAVAEKVAVEVKEYLDAKVEVGRHLADQLLLPLALAGGGSFRTLALSEHARSQVEIVKRFLDKPIEIRIEGPATIVEVG